jgi:glucose/mannose transport system permease protein
LSLGRVLIYAALIVAAVFFLVPFFVMVITSVKSMEDIRSGYLISWPRQFTLEAWRKAWDSACIGVNCVGMKGYFWNSVRMVVPSVVLSTLIGAMNGYVFAKWRFPGSETFFSLLLLGCFIPFQVILRRIVLPVSAPIFVVSIIWQTTQIWNDFLFGVVFSGSDSQPVTVALNNLVNTSTGVKEYNVDMAAAIIAGLPTLLVYIISGKYFVRGLTAGAVKG